MIPVWNSSQRFSGQQERVYDNSSRPYIRRILWLKSCVNFQYHLNQPGINFCRIDMQIQ